MISVVIPAYNEESNIEPLINSLNNQLKKYKDYEIILVDDGSKDNPLIKIKLLSENDEHIKYISFSRNFGHQKALKAGIDYSQGNCTISMDADMQHPPELIDQMITKWNDGFDVVYTIRKDTKDTGIMKKWTSEKFYNLINLLSDVYIPPGSADFRLLDKKVVQVVKEFEENWLFLRGIISWLGFKQTGIEYYVKPRLSGHSTYSIVKMISFAIHGITSFSILPLRIATLIGIFFSTISFFYVVYAIYIKLFTNYAIEGWTSTLISILFIGGIQLTSLGIIGEYIGKMFIETKHRPAYVIKESSFNRNER